MARIRRLKSLVEAREALGKLTSVWSRESELNTRMLLYVAELLEQQTMRKKRPLSRYQRYFSAQSKLGKSAGEIGRAWKERK